MRRSIRALLNSVGHHVGTFSSAEKFLEAYDDTTPGCLVLETRIADRTGLELQEQLVENGIILPVVFFTAYGDVEVAVEAMKRGAVDFLEKPVSGQRLLGAVTRALKRDARARSDRERRATVAVRVATLTAREREVLRLILQGRLSREIAATLSISPKTVETHRHHIMRKMQADGCAHLMKMMFSTGAVEAVEESPGPVGPPRGSNRTH